MKYVAYVRVSTIDQDLGLDAQLNIIQKFLQPNDTVIEYYTEKESGSKSNRIELTNAIECAKKNDAILLIAKLDRLSRNVSFISQLMDTKVQFRAIDLPNADSFTIHIFAALAQRELEMIQDRTKAALDAIKQNIKRDGYHISKAGNTITSLGKSEMKEEHRLMGVAAIKEKKLQNPNLKKAKAFAAVLYNNGMNYTQITNMLNQNGFKTSTGKNYMHTSTIRLFK